MTERGGQLSGPLAGTKVVEFAGIGPAPFAAMLLADMGAEVVRIERPGAVPLLPQNPDFLNRGRECVRLDLKSRAGRASARRLVDMADILIEGMRPGVMERLGLGPEAFERSNPKLVYGRMTGWGQFGPLSATAGHDINYIGLSGALHAIGVGDSPVVPLNLLGDFGGGALYLAFGVVCAFLEARSSGKGQVVDAAIVDGVAHLMAMIYSLSNSGLWSESRQGNLLDGGAPYYSTYACADGRFVAVGALEEKFYLELLALLGLSEAGLPDRSSRAAWPELRSIFAKRFRARTRDEWIESAEGTDACVSPVLAVSEAARHPHAAERRIYRKVGAALQPDVAPKLSRTPGEARPGSRGPAEIDDVLAAWSDGGGL